MLPNACPKPKKRVKSSKPRRIPATNPKRRKKLFQEDFGGREYLAYIHSLPCAICEAPCEYTEAAHVRSRGAGGKADDLVPLCGNRPTRAFNVTYIGCHFLFDAHDPETRQHQPRLRSLAKKLYATFLESQSAGSKRT